MRLHWKSPLFFWLIGCTSFAVPPQTEAENALELARIKIVAEPDNGAAHVGLAIALGKMTDFVSNRTKMEYAREIRHEAEIGLQLDSKNGEACRILARWHDGMSRLNPVLKAVATTLYGKVPPASFAEAERFFRRAAELAPMSVAVHGDLAEFLERSGRKKEAEVEWKRVLTLTPVDAEDRAFLEKARLAVE